MSTVIKKEKKNLLKFYFKIELTILQLKINLMTPKNCIGRNQQTTIFYLVTNIFIFTHCTYKPVLIFVFYVFKYIYIYIKKAYKYIYYYFNEALGYQDSGAARFQIN